MDDLYKDVVDFLSSGGKQTATSTEISEHFGWDRKWTSKLLLRMSHWQVVESVGVSGRARIYALRNRATLL